MTMIDEYGLDAVAIEYMNQLGSDSSDSMSSSDYAASDDYARAYSRYSESSQSGVSGDSTRSERSFFGQMWEGIKEKGPIVANDALVL